MSRFVSCRLVSSPLLSPRLGPPLLAFQASTCPVRSPPRISTSSDEANQTTPAHQPLLTLRLKIHRVSILSGDAIIPQSRRQPPTVCPESECPSSLSPLVRLPQRPLPSPPGQTGAGGKRCDVHPPAHVPSIVCLPLHLLTELRPPRDKFPPSPSKLEVELSDASQGHDEQYSRPLESPIPTSTRRPALSLRRPSCQRRTVVLAPYKTRGPACLPTRSEPGTEEYTPLACLGRTMQQS